MSVAIVDAMDAMEMAHRAHYKGKVDQLVPFCALINADGSIHTIMNMPMANDDEKDAGVMALVLAMARMPETASSASCPATANRVRKS